jgi:hypothetical protein
MRLGSSFVKAPKRELSRGGLVVCAYVVTPLSRGAQLTGDEFIGKVVASYLRDRLGEEDSTGVAHYLLDRLTTVQTTVVANTIFVSGPSDARVFGLRGGDRG